MLLAGILDKFHYGLVRVFVFERRNVALRLIENQIDVLLAADTLVVEAHLVRRLHLRSEFGYHYSVHADETCRDEVVSLAARAESRLRHEAVQTDFAGYAVRIVFRIRFGFVVETAFVATGFPAALVAVCRTLAAESLVAELLAAMLSVAIGFATAVALEFALTELAVSERLVRFIAVELTVAERFRAERLVRLVVAEPALAERFVGFVAEPAFVAVVRSVLQSVI